MASLRRTVATNGTPHTHTVWVWRTCRPERLAAILNSAQRSGSAEGVAMRCVAYLGEDIVEHRAADVPNQQHVVQVGHNRETLVPASGTDGTEQHAS